MNKQLARAPLLQGRHRGKLVQPDRGTEPGMAQPRQCWSLLPSLAVGRQELNPGVACPF